MKTKVNYAIVFSIFIVLIIGIIAICFTYTTKNPKAYRETHSSNGKLIVTQNVDDENVYRYVKQLETKNIRYSEYLNRLAKYRKIIMDKSKAAYKSNESEENLITYNSNKASYEIAKNEADTFERTLLISCFETFFGTYFPIILLLIITLLVNTKINYGNERRSKDLSKTYMENSHEKNY